VALRRMIKKVVLSCNGLVGMYDGDSNAMYSELR
jgi:hypothetical protein